MAITNATLAQQISEMVNYWRTRDLQFADWVSGAANGGPYNDGRYALSDYLGVVRYTKSPAALESSVSGSASSASAAAAASAAAQALAEGARNAAQAARDLALTYRDGAQAARDLALSYRADAANHAANALVYRNAAETAETNAETAEANAETAQAASEAAHNTAQTHATNAANSASLAASSAAAAATFDPSTYYSKVASDARYAQLAGATFAGLVGMSYASPDLILNATDAPADNRRFRVRVNGVGQVQFSFTNDALSSATNWLTVARSGNTPTITFGAPLLVETSGTSAPGRNIEFKTAGQANVAFGSYTGAWRPSLTIQGDTNANYLFMVGPSSDADQARIYSTRRLFLRAATGYMDVVTGDATSSGFRFYASDGATLKGYVYHDTGGFGLLGNLGSWGLQIPIGANRPRFPNHLESEVFYAFDDTSRWIQNNASSLTYGAWMVGGTRSGYAGLAIYDGVLYPTLMSNGTAAGIFNQGPGKWMFYTYSSTRIDTEYDWLRFGRGAFLHHGAGSNTSGIISTSTAAPSGTPANGDIWIQHAA